MKLFGAVITILGSSAVGFGMCQSIRREQQSLEQLVILLEWMKWELADKMPPLSILCRRGAEQCGGIISEVFSRLARELEGQIVQDVSLCMVAAIGASGQVPNAVLPYLEYLGTNMGAFDLQGQLQALESVQKRCTMQLDQMRSECNERIRTCKALSICAGVTMVILFI